MDVVIKFVGARNAHAYRSEWESLGDGTRKLGGSAHLVKHERLIFFKKSFNRHWGGFS